MGILNINLSFLTDPLSLFFLFTVLLVSIPSAVYSIGYLKGEYSSGKTALSWALVVIFILAMAFVVTAGNLLVFLIAWEVMSLVSYFLVTSDNSDHKSVRAGTIYIVMTHIGTAFIAAAFFIMFSHSGSFDILAIKDSCKTMPLSTKNLLFILMLIGFGTKAGIVPLHVWLPYAHPQAPSHVSSIMSGAMIKTAVYGMLRFVIFILGVNASWWGSVIIVLALSSCLVGVTYALMERDIKKLLAYSSIENMGIVMLGVGTSVLLFRMNLPVLAVFAMSAGLYHLINHALFKALLFSSAGAVYKITKTRNIEKMGGLIKTMPWTAASFLVGSMAISAIIPFNGFVSEWLTLQALFNGAVAAPGMYKIFMAVSASLLILTGGLAAATFVKAFGIMFLGMPRTSSAEEAEDIGFSMKAVFVFFASLVLIFGIVSGPIIRMLVNISGCATGIDTGGITFTLNNFTLSSGAGNSVFLSVPILAAIITVIIILTVLVYYFISGKRRSVSYRTWDCGYYNLDSRTEYSATAFSKPFRIAFSFFLLPYTKTEKIRETFYYVKSFKYEVFTTPVFKKYIYEPAINIVLKLAGMLKKMQPGSIHLYIAYIFFTVIVLIILIGRM